VRIGRGGAEVPSGFKFKWRFFERRNTERLFIKAARGDFRVRWCDIFNSESLSSIAAQENKGQEESGVFWGRSIFAWFKGALPQEGSVRDLSRALDQLNSFTHRRRRLSSLRNRVHHPYPVVRECGIDKGGRAE